MRIMPVSLGDEDVVNSKHGGKLFSFMTYFIIVKFH